jgi:hypothetical protein
LTEAALAAFLEMFFYIYGKQELAIPNLPECNIRNSPLGRLQYSEGEVPAPALIRCPDISVALSLDFPMTTAISKHDVPLKSRQSIWAAISGD